MSKLNAAESDVRQKAQQIAFKLKTFREHHTWLTDQNEKPLKKLRRRLQFVPSNNHKNMWMNHMCNQATKTWIGDYPQ